MMDYDERERKQMHYSSGPVRIYRAGPDEIGEGVGSSGGDGGSGGGGGMAAAEVGTLAKMKIHYYTRQGLVLDTCVFTVYL